MSNIWDDAKNIPEAEEKRNTFILDTAQTHGNNVIRG